MTDQAKPTINLSAREYFALPRRGLRKWRYFARHPILAFVTYQLAYPDPPEARRERTDRLWVGIGYGLARMLARHHS